MCPLHSLFDGIIIAYAGCSDQFRLSLDGSRLGGHVFAPLGALQQKENIFLAVVAAQRGPLVPALLANQPRAALIGQIGPSPLNHHQQPIPKTNEIENMNDQPGDPRKEAGEFDKP